MGGEGRRFCVMSPGAHDPSYASECVASTDSGSSHVIQHAMFVTSPQLKYDRGELLAIRRTMNFDLISPPIDELKFHGLLRYRGRRGRRHARMDRFTTVTTNQVWPVNETDSSYRSIRVITGQRPERNHAHKLRTRVCALVKINTTASVGVPKPSMPVDPANRAMNFPPTLYVFNAAALSKPHAIDQLEVD